MAKEEPTTSQIFFESVVKEELIIEDELPPEPHCEDMLISTSGFEMTIKNEPTDHDELGKPETAPRPTLRCGKCKKLFHRTESYRVHCKKHEAIEGNHFLCKPCKRPFATKHGLFLHRRLKHDGDQLEGSKDSHNSPMKNALQKHVTLKKYGNELKILEEDDVFKCSTCLKKFSQLYLIERHIRRHRVAKYLNQKWHDFTEKNVTGSKPLSVQKDGQDLFKCPICSKLFPNRTSCRIHISGHRTRAKKLVQCETCELHVGSHKELEEHEISKHGKIKAEPSETDEKGHFKCNECPKTFANRKFLLRHIERRLAIDEGRYQCKICGKCLGSNRCLLKHSLKKHNEYQKVILDPLQIDGSGRFKCSRCPATFARRTLCITHIRRHTVIDEALYKCKACLKCFSDKKSLNRHEQGAIKNQTKSGCFQNRQQLEPENTDKKYHIIEENGVFKCSDCKSVFPKRRGCFDHILRHEAIDKGIFKCQTCGKRFSFFPALRSHALLIHGEKLKEAQTPMAVERDENGMFLCSECPKKYVIRKSWIYHIRGHENMRSGKYKCEECQICFGRIDKLFRHVSKHNKEKSATSKASTSKEGQIVVIKEEMPEGRLSDES